MRALTYSLTVLSTLVTLGCTNGHPTFGVLNQSAIPQITFGGQTDRAIELGGLGLTSALAGECDPRVRQVDVVVRGGSRGHLDLLAVGSPIVACGTAGTFSLTLKALRDLIPSATANQSYVIEFRAETPGGISNPSFLRLTYVRELVPPLRVTAGATESSTSPRVATSVHFRADVRLTNRVNAADATAGAVVTRASSANFQMRQGRARMTTPF